jgi:hypothetical protein
MVPVPQETTAAIANPSRPGMCKAIQPMQCCACDSKIRAWTPAILRNCGALVNCIDCDRGCFFLVANPSAAFRARASDRTVLTFSAIRTERIESWGAKRSAGAALWNIRNFTATYSEQESGGSGLGVASLGTPMKRRFKEPTHSSAGLTPGDHAVSAMVKTAAPCAHAGTNRRSSEKRMRTSRWESSPHPEATECVFLHGSQAWHLIARGSPNSNATQRQVFIFNPVPGGRSRWHPDGTP